MGVSSQAIAVLDASFTLNINSIPAQAAEWVATQRAGVSSQDEFVLDTAELERRRAPTAAAGAAVAAQWSEEEDTPAAKRARCAVHAVDDCILRPEEFSRLCRSYIGELLSLEMASLTLSTMRRPSSAGPASSGAGAGSGFDQFRFSGAGGASGPCAPAAGPKPAVQAIGAASGGLKSPLGVFNAGPGGPGGPASLGPAQGAALRPGPQKAGWYPGGPSHPQGRPTAAPAQWRLTAPQHGGPAGLPPAGTPQQWPGTQVGVPAQLSEVFNGSGGGAQQVYMYGSKQ